MGFSMELHQTDTQLWISLYPAQSAYRTCIEGNSVKIKEHKSQTAASSTHMALITGISWTQLQSCKHEWSCGHYNLNCNSAYSDYCLSFMMWPHAPLLSTPLALPDSVHGKRSAQIQVPPAAAEDQDLKAMQSQSSAALRCWGWGHSLLLGTALVPHHICTPMARVMQTCSSPTPWADWGLRELCVAPQPAVGKVRSFLQPLSRALTTHIATWAGHWVPGLGPSWSCKGKMV